MPQQPAAVEVPAPAGRVPVEPARVEVVVGVIGRAHGIRGDVAITLRTDEPERRFAVGQVLLDEASRRRYTVDSARWHGERLLVRFAELADRTAVEQARGIVLVTEVAADERPDDEDEYYDRQLVGLEARCDGRRVGAVTSVIHLAAQDLLALQTDSGERLVPFVTELVPVVDLAGGFVEVVDVPGLLADEDADEVPPPAAENPSADRGHDHEGGAR